MNICFNCKEDGDNNKKLINGWKDNAGHYVHLCFNCSYIYQAGQFCEMFHSDEDGWKDCESCKKLIHCGCIVSVGDYIMHDSGGITCCDCSDTHGLLARDWSNDESHSADVADLGNDTDPDFVLTPLFEKLVSPTDSKLKHCRILIPTKSAMAYFPAVSGHGVVPLNIQDTDGKEWDVCFRFGPRDNRKTYYLTGLRDFMVSKNLQAGDTVAFYRRESDGKIILELRKPSLKKYVCFNCKEASCYNKLIYGWKDNVGRYVQLCFNCSNIYQAGQFCEMFHSDEDGWKDCESCKKSIHCGCIVSIRDYIMHDSGGITCNTCSDTHCLLARDWSNDESHSTCVADLSNDTDLDFVLAPLFEKVMSPTDSNLSHNRILIPMKALMAYFPAVSGHEMVPLNIQDTDGKEWDVCFRCCHHNNRSTYYLTGLRDFMVSKNLQAGETVAFYRRESDGKIILELKKPLAYP